MKLKPFWRYYGGKYRAAPRYPAPEYDTIIEPFAGAAGYSMRYPERKVILVEKYPVIAEMWRYLIGVSAAEVLSVPLVDSVNDLPASTPRGARFLVGFAMNAATVSPCVNLSSGRKKLRAAGRSLEGWSEGMRARVAAQVDHIRHWKIIEGDFTDAPDIEATWFIDPPYSNRAGSYYVHSKLDFAFLGEVCQGLKGQVIVCENEGATWLPFKPFGTFKPGLNGTGSKEVIWLNSSHPKEHK